MAWQLVVNTHMKILLLIVLLAFPTVALSEGRTYVPKEELAHCTLWDTVLRQWPATSLGLEPRECRRRAVAPTTSSTITCRLQREYFDPDTHQRMCVYDRGAHNQGQLIIPMDKVFQCPRTTSCKQSLSE